MASRNKEKWPQEAKVSLLLIFSQLNYKKKIEKVANGFIVK